MGIGHEDTKELDALREALVKLLIHTDYFSPMKPRIRVFTNRIEFENPDALPRPLEQLLKNGKLLYGASSDFGEMLPIEAPYR
jgi:predicted HTH transcriptional regulator